VRLIWLVACVVVLGCASPPSPVPGAPGSPAEGVVVGVTSTGLTEVQGFSIRTRTGERLDFRLGRLENAAEFPPAHLVEHQASAVPVRVFFRLEGEDRVAYRIEDAG
jgi:hypothetical protein